MSSLAVLIPVKGSGIKSRLSSALSGTERREFETILLCGVLEALEGADLLASTHVVSSDPKILRLASSMGAGAIREAKDRGVNAAVEAGISGAGRPRRVLVLPSDLPHLRAAEVGHLLSLGRSLQVVIAPSSSFNGTNALLFPPAGGLALSYDDDSFWNHIRSAAQKGLSVGVATEPGLTFDVDSPEDLRRLSQSRSGGRAAEFARRNAG
jgi:2-phospho-L-lactate guanylyltransferase